MPKKGQILLFIIIGLLIFLSLPSGASKGKLGTLLWQQVQQQDTTTTDSTKAKTDSVYIPSRRSTYEAQDRYGDPFSSNLGTSPLMLEDPSSLTLDLEIDTGLNYTITERIGDINYRPSTSMTFEEFQRYQDEKILRDYWKERAAGLDGESAVSGRSLIPPLYVSPVFDRLFGGSFVEIVPNGFVTLDFGGRVTKNANPSIPVRQQTYTSFEFDQQISMNAVGKVGEKLQVTANFSNNNSFDFQNDLKVEYTGYEEEIIKKIEIGNVSMPVNNSLITGAQNLFGVKTQLQFGRLFVTGVASTQRGTTESKRVEGGAQRQEFEIRSSDYDENRHFFLGHFFRNNYERWLSNLPRVTSIVNVRRVEVYVINRTQNTTNLRSVAAFMDLGEANPEDVYKDQFLNGTPSGAPTDNDANNLYDQVQALNKNYDQFGATVESLAPNFTKTVDYELLNVARKLDPTEYSFHPKLGYISLRRQLQNDEMLAVAFEYNYNGENYTVGELAETYGNRPEDQVVLLKLLRPSKINVDVPTWDLMMKNIYNLNGSQITQEGFQLRIIYRDDRTGQDNPSLHESSLKDLPLIRLMNMDSLNQNGDPQPDGNFDYVNDITIDQQDGKIIFPVLEPFGSHLESLFRPTEQTFVGKYVFNTLYNSTKNDAQQQTSKDKFFITGRYQSGSSTRISLPGINISPNSVRVMAGGTALQEGIDYRVDYNLGQVTILNDGVLNSGKDLNITYEKEDIFNFQSRTLVGTRFDYIFSDKINFGATLLRHTQRPLGVSRYSIGNEPVNNTKWGLDANYSSEWPFLTKMVDFLPFIDTKEPSTITFRGEFAQMIPGTTAEVAGEGTSYIDDFETSITSTNLDDFESWQIAATPSTANNSLTGNGALGVNDKRAKLAWFEIDNIFYQQNGINVPDNLTEDDRENHYVRAVSTQEIFKNRDQQDISTNLERVFNLAYFPSERGPYNYNADLTGDGKLKNPEDNWGGVSRAITSEVDFDKSNIEYIEFWLMDPFIQGERGVVNDGTPDATNNTTGGKLFFNLGSISEDILPDDKHSYENGLPVDGNDGDVDITEWGRVPNRPPLTDAFANTASARENQDIGLDGVKSEDEASFYSQYANAIANNASISQQAKDQILSDISGDDFNYYLSEELDNRDAKILERYKNYNNTEGNSPVAAGNQSFNPSGSRYPDNEDLNNDKTVFDVEEFYEYEVNLQPSDLNVANNPLIVDEVTAEANNTKWYLFRIPIRNPDRTQGDISGFKTIRFMRTYLTGFAQPVVLRMVDFRLVGSQWRKYDGNLSNSGISETPEEKPSNLVVSVVSIESNSESGAGKVPYVLPPGIERDFDNTNVRGQVRQNEQSLQLCVDDLEDGKAVSAFKNVTYDLINYGRLKMFLHAQSQTAEDEEITAFVRLGTDFEDNYYEVELPLQVTPYGSTDPQVIWPEQNEIDIAFDKLYELKSRRNNIRGSQNVLLPYSEQFGKYKLTVRGRPDMSSVQTIMIGMRNPKGGQTLPQPVCIWANEMRVTDFDQTSGWAANATLNTKMADFANITASTTYTSFGFGGIQENINERTRETSTGFDVSGNFSLGKFFKEESGIRIPMYLGYQTFTATPYFDPRDPDIPLEASLNSFETDEERNEYRNLVIDQERRRAINFTNVRKERTETDKLLLPIAIENFNVTYAYNDVVRSNLEIADFESRTYKAALGYNYAFPNASIAPFEKAKWLKSPYLKLIRDINFNPLPSTFNFRTDLDRSYVKTQYRNDNLTTFGVEPQFQKSFTFTRTYNLNWNLMQNLSLDYNARAYAIIDEAPGEINTEQKRDSIINNILSLGRMKTFDQSFVTSYKVPFDKLPLTDWVSSDVRYKVDFNWTSASLDQIDSIGNTIQNNSEIGVNGRLDMTKLYNKVKVLNSINNPPRLRAGQTDTTWASPGGKFIKGLLKLAMSLKNITGNYSQRSGTILPGFRKRPYLFGLDSAFNGPGLPFILGSQDPGIKAQAVRNDWLAKGSNQTAPFTQSIVKTFDIKATVEPITDLNIQIEVNKTVNDNYQELFIYNSQQEQFNTLTPSRSGNYAISYMAIKTAFEESNEDLSSAVFDQFRENREIIAARLERANSNGGFYLQNQQDVLIPAFLAAYTDRDANEISLDPFPQMPIPNWRVDYKGLSKIKAISKIFPSFTISHAYNSTFTVNNFISNGLYETNLTLNNEIENYPLPSITSDSGSYIPVYNLSNVVISERFAPLIGLNLRTKGRLTAKVEYKKERNLSLNTETSQLTEQRNNDVVLDIGFTDSDFKLPFKVKGRTVALKNDLTMRLSVTVRNSEVVQRSLAEGDNTLVDGNISFQLRPTANYIVNKRLSLNLYYERSFNEPRIQNSFRTTNTAFGVQVRFSLQ